VDRSRAGWLASLQLPPIPRAIIPDCCGLLDALAAPIGRLERQIAGLAKPDPRVQALQVLPGVGRLTAMTLVAEIGDIDRFPTARKLGAWAGLTPRCATCDRKVGHGHITKQGSVWVRWILQEAAHTAKRSPQFAGTYGQLAHRRASRSPPWRSPVGCWPAASTSSRRSRPPPPLQKARPGALVFPLEPATRPPGLTEQPGPDAIVMRTPPRARMGACEPTPVDRPGLLAIRSCAGRSRRQGRSTPRALHLDPGRGRRIQPPRQASQAPTGAGSACAPDRARRKLSTSVRQVDQGFVVPGVSSSGLLIHAAVGSWGGVGGLRTNRSGWAA
jgi:hypothetical protein